MEGAVNYRQGSMPFRPRARLIHAVGDDLISDEVVAIIELIKNAYDADATEVLIEFTPQLHIGTGMITVMDNGHGMSLNTVLTDWMQPATSRKEREHKTAGGRRVLGEKGIGRFAASLLADELDLVTRATNSEVEVRALFDWTEFDRKEFLDEVFFLWEEGPPVDIRSGGIIERIWPKAQADDPARHGTVMRLSRLRTDWDETSFKRLRTALSRLRSPTSALDNFVITLALPDEFSLLSGQITAPASLSFPTYSIKGHVEENGSYDLQFVHAQTTTSIHDRHSLSPRGRLAACGPFDVEFRVWDRDTSTLSNLAESLNTTLNAIQDDLNEAAGVSVYRDGFRVLPYGEPQNDWLRLDMRRVQNPTARVSNNQVIGLIFISADRNPLLKDQTNREGLKQGQAARDLRDLAIAVIAELEKRRYVIRRVEPDPEGIPRNRRSTRGRNLFAGMTLASLSDLAARKYGQDAELRQAIEEKDREIAQRVELVKTVFSRYSRLATLGQLVDRVLHDGMTYVAKLENEAGLGHRRMAKLFGDTSAVLDITKRFDDIGRYANSLSGLFQRLQPFSGRVRGQLEMVEIETLIVNAINIFATDMANLHIQVAPLQTHTLLKVIPGEVEQIFLNLMQNSIYWLQEVPENARSIQCQVQQVSAEEVEVLFCDSGRGVEEAFRDFIFDPYFTMRDNGSGLGLTIAGEIAAEYDGHLELVWPGSLSGACFRLTLRQRSV